MPYVQQTVFRSLDPKTGRPDVDPDPQAGHRQEGGGHLSVALGRQELAADRLQPEDADDLHPGQREPVRLADRHRGRVRGRRALHRRDQRSAVLRPGADHVGEVQAWNVDTGAARVDAHVSDLGELGLDAGHRPAGWCSPAAPTTASCTRSTRESGKLLWEFPTNSGILAPPSSFTIDGKQYIAVQSGWGIDSRGMQSRLNTLTGGALPGGARGRRDLGVRGAVIGRPLRSAAAIGTRTQTPPRRGCRARRRTAPGPRWRRWCTP